MHLELIHSLHCISILTYNIIVVVFMYIVTSTQVNTLVCLRPVTGSADMAGFSLNVPAMYSAVCISRENPRMMALLSMQSPLSLVLLIPLQISIGRLSPAKYRVPMATNIRSCRNSAPNLCHRWRDHWVIHKKGHFMIKIREHKMGKNARENPYTTSFPSLVPTPIKVKTMFQVSGNKLISK